MVKLNKKSNSFIVILIVTGWMIAFSLFYIISYGMHVVFIFVALYLMLCTVLLITSGRSFEVCDSGITVVTLHFFRKKQEWNQKPRFFICTLKVKACLYNRYIIIPLKSKYSEISEPMMHTWWYSVHPSQAVIYPYSRQVEQEILKQCPNIDLVWVWSKFEP